MQLNLRRLLSRENLRDDILEERNICRMFLKMVQAVSVCHERGIIHRDVKLENFLVQATSPSNSEMDIKLSDFGIACMYDKVDPPSACSGSMVGIAPEVLSQVPYDFKVDCWSLGVILYELLTLRHPFNPSPDSLDTFSSVLTDSPDFTDDNLWRHTSQEAKDLTRKLLSKDPS